MNYFFFACLIVIATGSCSASADYHVHAPEKEKHAALFVFGDSLYDPGNNNYINTTFDFLANFRPYGESFFKNPSGRFSDGRLIPDFIAEYAKLPLIGAYLRPGISDFTYGTNFASGGGGALVGTHKGFVIDLHMQLSYFNKVNNKLRQKLGDEKAKTLLSDAVYMFSIGGNDYIEPLTTNSTLFQSLSKKEYVDMVIGNFSQVIEGVYKKGARKFVFISMVPLSGLPNIKIQAASDGGSLAAEATKLVKLHNKAIPKLIQKLETQLKGFNYSYFDMHTYTSQILNHPSKYGFKDATTACCGSGKYNGIYSCGGKRPMSKDYELCENPREHVFFDSFHPGEQVYQILAKLMWSGNQNVIAPYNVESLFKV